ncbi:tripartite tricarboxylate transporter TctB family protein [uncultured Bifidobacterium sp.]|uniref:tripartite tricarboxylate transporter TctB family protein n=1 Tax=uncultured Bifidobacterium sp. TaxID=165187 RepID=UPI00258C650F|nr:tripartite tricarboxylate transporter TctB family protein [uncultured Bifidobacterium sp.]
MPNRAERRAQEKRNRRGVPQQYDQTKGRARSGMIDEYALQQKSIRLQEGTDTGGAWKPTASFEQPEVIAETDLTLRNPKLFKAPHSLHQWFRVISWILIVIAAIAFVVVMWLPTKPIWLVLAIAIVFAVGVVSLFFTAGNSKHNPNLDANGTAV